MHTVKKADGCARETTADEAFYVLDRDLQIVLASNGDTTNRLPAVVEASVRELISDWTPAGFNAPGIARPLPYLVLRTQPMLGPAGLFVGVRIGRSRVPDSLSGPAARFHITPREVQVLALVLDGLHLVQIGEQLFITSSTVQDHIRSMLDKTASRNRSELIARMLGWESASQVREA